MQRTQASPITFTNKFRGLANNTAVCYANASFQVLFSTQPFRNFLNLLSADDTLRKFAQKYFDDSPSRITSSVYYREMEICAPDGENDDLVSFFSRMLSKYNQLHSVFGIPDRKAGDTVISYRAYLGITRKEDIQRGIDSTTFIKSTMPPLINVVADRQYYLDNGVSTITKEPIVINNYIRIESNVFKLRGILVHTGNQNSGHFRAIIITNERQIFADDSRITHMPPIEYTTDFIYRNTAMCIYETCDSNLADDTVFVINESESLGRITDTEHNDPSFDATHHSSDGSSDTTSSRNQVLQTEVTASQTQDKRGPRNKRKRELKPTDALFIRTGKEGLIDIPEEVNEICLDDSWTNIVHDRSKLSNIHDEFLYMHGFLATETSKSPTCDIECSPPKFQTKLDILEKVVRSLGKITFNYKETNGEYNAETMQHALQLQALILSKAQAVSAADELRRYIDSIKDGHIPSDETINRNIEEKLHDILEKESILTDDDCYTHCPSCMNQDEEEMFYTLGPKYNWRARCDELNVESITKKIQKFNDESDGDITDTEDMHTRNVLREKLWEDYKNNIHQFNSIPEFVHNWVELRNKGKLKDDISFTENYAAKLIREFIASDGVTQVKKRSGAKSKMSQNAVLCLVTTVLDFPDATDAERTHYLNTYANCNCEHVCQKTVNNVLHGLNITIKCPSFSPRARNCFGYRVARILWA